MTSTRGRRTFDLPPSVRHALADHHFQLLREGDVKGPHVYNHRLAPALMLWVSLSPRSGTIVLFVFKNVPEHLKRALPWVTQDCCVDAFDDRVRAFESVIVQGYAVGPKVADRTGLTD